MKMNHAIRVGGARMRLVALVAALMSWGSGAAAISSTVMDTRTVETNAAAHGSGMDSGVAGSAFRLATWSQVTVGRIDSEVLRLALAASQCATASGVVEDPATLTIIDYSKASVEPRMWVLDLRTRTLLYEELVSHGQGSGGNLATRFSNTPDSHQTSIGLFVTDEPYVGRNGYSLRLDGLDKGFNDRARERAIVMHGAAYVNAAVTKTLGRLGRSHGCPAVRDDVARELIDRVKGGGLVFAYYPDAEWLKSSKFLGKCAN